MALRRFWWAAGPALLAAVAWGAVQPPVYTNADFSGASLSQRHWAHGRLNNVDFQYADLHGSDLRGANLSHTCLRGTDLRGADLRGACLVSTNLCEANLREARLDGVRLDGAMYSDETRWPRGFRPEQHGGFRVRADSPWYHFAFARER